MVVSWYEDDGRVSSCNGTEMHHRCDDVILTTLMPHRYADTVMYSDHQFVMLRCVHDSVPLCLHGVTKWITHNEVTAAKWVTHYGSHSNKVGNTHGVSDKVGNTHGVSDKVGNTHGGHSYKQTQS